MKPRKWGKIEKMTKKLTVSKILCMAGFLSLVESYAAGFLPLLGDCGGCFFKFLKARGRFRSRIRLIIYTSVIDTYLLLLSLYNIILIF